MGLRADRGQRDRGARERRAALASREDTETGGIRWCPASHASGDRGHGYDGDRPRTIPVPAGRAQDLLPAAGVRCGVLDHRQSVRGIHVRAHDGGTYPSLACQGVWSSGPQRELGRQRRAVSGEHGGGLLPGEPEERGRRSGLHSRVSGCARLRSRPPDPRGRGLPGGARWQLVTVRQARDPRNPLVGILGPGHLHLGQRQVPARRGTRADRRAGPRVRGEDLYDS